MIFGLFKKKKKENTDKDISEIFGKINKLFNTENSKFVLDLYSLVFFQLKTLVFTLLAPVDLNNNDKLHKLYNHKFSLGYIYGLIIALIQSNDFMKKKEEQLHQLLFVEMTKSLFGFSQDVSENYFKMSRTVFAEDKIFLKGISAGANEFIKFQKGRFKGKIGIYFDQGIKEFVKDLN
tara:strand:- start:301 stop:834 length:534 start_codon:yes stop_codon:yes gene_type:complete